MLGTIVSLSLAVGPVVTDQQLDVALNPATGLVEGATMMQVVGGGDLAYELNPAAQIHRVVVNGNDIAVRHHNASTDNMEKDAHFHVTRCVSWEVLIESCCLLVVFNQQHLVHPEEYQEEEVVSHSSTSPDKFTDISFEDI